MSQGLLLRTVALALVALSTVTGHSAQDSFPVHHSHESPLPFSNAFVYSDLAAQPAFKVLMEYDALISEAEAVARQKSDPNAVLLPIQRPSGKLYYLCQTSPQTATPDVRLQPLEAISPAVYASRLRQTLKAVQGLDRKCLIYTQGWWEYEYCHLRHVRQYHRPAERDPAYPNAEGQRLDYILGRPPVPASPPPSGGVTSSSVPQKGAETGDQPIPGMDSSALIEFDEEARHYLRMRWTHGGVCEITGNPRQIEVQFHCCHNDHIASVREMAVCNYVMIVHTKRVCGLQWFRGKHENLRGGAEQNSAGAQAGEVVCSPVRSHSGPLAISREELASVLRNERQGDILKSQNIPDHPTTSHSKDSIQTAQTSTSPASSTDPHDDHHPGAAPRNAPLELAEGFSFLDEQDPIEQLLNAVLYDQGEYDDEYDMFADADEYRLLDEEGGEIAAEEFGVGSGGTLENDGGGDHRGPRTTTGNTNRPPPTDPTRRARRADKLHTLLSSSPSSPDDDPEEDIYTTALDELDELTDAEFDSLIAEWAQVVLESQKAAEARTRRREGAAAAAAAGGREGKEEEQGNGKRKGSNTIRIVRAVPEVAGGGEVR
ncbi:uncharacterized protein EV422DRAFT_568640 [Fimicolochytrium jonesii]|uniref:uncharacterized protein n=1 Tax=Fimicolochytrium jonesii TaxID=1396493 RepID=UPI0022FF0191|nr:uncharacterized protein EV422DRAFT_568640 [Fimicolochytrium jonesii]KAI8819680.1 hypothetical protein EV422DRAFT_568640 [Fimicolochytrium jonesii]